MKKFQTAIILLIALILHQADSFCLEKIEYPFNFINSESGLSTNGITCIYKDRKGYMWIGTPIGLNRLDGYNIKIFKQNYKDTTTISNNHVHFIFQDYSQLMWVNTGAGLNIYDPATETFSKDYRSILKQRHFPFHILDAINRIQGNEDYTIYFNRRFGYVIQNNHTGKNIYYQKASSHNPAWNCLSTAFEGNDFLWILNNHFQLEKIDLKSGRTVKRLNHLYRKIVYDFKLMYLDSKKNFWIATRENTNELIRFNYETKEIRYFKKGESDRNLSNDVVTSVTEDQSGKIWIGTDHGGINIYNPKSDRFTYLTDDPNNKFAISQNSITTIYKDRDNIIWVGTFKQGLNYYHPSLQKFKTVKLFPEKNDITGIDDDSKGYYWIGTNGMGLYRMKPDFSDITRINYAKDQNNNNVENVVVCLFVDSKDRVWIGTFMNGIFRIEGNKVTHYKKETHKGMTDNNIWSIKEDSRGIIWFATLNNGASTLDPESEKFTSLRIMSKGYEDCSRTLFYSKEGQMWCGTIKGIDVFNMKGQRIKQINLNEKNKNVTDRNFINHLIQDRRGFIWATTMNGLACINPKNDSITVLDENDGLPDNCTLTVVEDLAGNIWVSSSKGISKINVKYDSGKDIITVSQIENFSKSDGVQDGEFIEKSGFCTPAGEIMFGGAKGINIIDTKNKFQTNNKIDLIFTDVTVNNHPLAYQKEFNGRVILEKPLYETKSITLQHTENSIIFDFAAINFFNPEKYRFQYQLEGFSNDWITVAPNNRKAIFTNLNSGKYTLRVRAVLPEKGNQDNTITLEIIILPPFWKTTNAYLLYILVTMVLAIVIYKILVDRATLKLKAAQKAAEAKRIEELSALKIKFFTNLSHELRTPVSLIISPVEQMLKKATDPMSRRNLEMVRRNVKRLLFMVNQLLDFRKLEMDEIHLNAVNADIVEFVRDVSHSFVDISENKGIHFEFKTDLDEVTMSFDPIKIERILFNLLSNAYKFTEAPGNITVNITRSILPEDNERPLKISVTDTGIGMPPEKIESIFTPFFQIDGPSNILNQGSGIGLSISKEFVLLHDGLITVESAPGKGTCFTIHLPVRQTEAKSVEIIPKRMTETMPSNQVLDETQSVEQHQKRILIVEDNEDLRFYLVDNLRNYFDVYDAPNGQIGLKLAIEKMPDVIVSDVVMPVMDGMELCRQIRKDVRISHTSFILLTAQTLVQQKIEGYNIGADDYLTKPFNFEVLVARIRNLIARNEKQKAVLNAEGKLVIQNEYMNDIDEQFLEEMESIIDTEIKNPHFSESDLAQATRMSSTFLNKKLLSLTGKNANEFILSVRLKKAAQMLGRSDRSISSVMSELGFDNIKLFNKLFKDEYGVSPSEYAKYI